MIKRVIAIMYGWSRKTYYDYHYSLFRKQYKIKTNFLFQGTDIRIYGEGDFIPGNDSYIGSYSTLQINKGNKIVIGNKCSISHNVRMYTSTNIADQNFVTVDMLEQKDGDIVIGDGVWIGANVFINPGVTIGSNSIIGANSVVTKDIPTDSIWGGVPAKFIKNKN